VRPFSVTTDGSGNVTLYAWGGNGVDGNSGNTGINPYINGFTIESVTGISHMHLDGLGRRDVCWFAEKKS